jgi:hypothetical protein
MTDTILSSPGELSGALNRARPVPRRREGRFMGSATTRQQPAELQDTTTPLANRLSAETT